MTRRLNLLTVTLLSSLLFLGLHCSNFDLSTNVGRDLANDLDSTIGDPSSIMTRLSVQTPIVSTASVRDTTPVHQAHITVGRWDDDEYAIAYFTFDTLWRMPLADSVDSIRITLRPSQQNVGTGELAFVVEEHQLKGRQERPRQVRVGRTFGTIAFEADSARTEQSVVLPPDQYTITDTSLADPRLNDDHLVLEGDATVPDTLKPVEWYSPVFDTTATDTVFHTSGDYRCTTTVLPGTVAAAYDSLDLTSLDLATTRDTFWTVSRDTTWPVVDSAGDTTTESGVVIDTIIDTIRVFRCDFVILEEDSFFQHSLTDTLVSDTLAPGLLLTADTTSYPNIAQTPNLRDAIRDSVRISTTRIAAYKDSTSRVTTRDYHDTTEAGWAQAGYHIEYHYLQRDSVLLRVDTIWLDTSHSTFTAIDTFFADTSLGRQTRIDHRVLGAPMFLDSTLVSLPNFGFALASADPDRKGVLRFNRPELTLYYTDYREKDTVHTTRVLVANYQDYSVFEDNAPAREDSAIASAGPQRHAILGFSLEPLWAQIDSTADAKGFGTIAGATMVLPVESHVQEDTTAELIVQYSLLESPDLPPDSLTRSRFARRLDSDGIVDTLVFDTRMLLDRFRRDVSPRPDSAYLYVRLFDARLVIGTASYPYEYYWQTMVLGTDGIQCEVTLTAPELE